MFNDYNNDIVFFLITYDLVSNPSHAKARVLEFLPESVDLSSVNSQSVICESVENNADILLLKEDRVLISNDDSPEKIFIENILEEKFFDSLKQMKFRF